MGILIRKYWEYLNLFIVRVYGVVVTVYGVHKDGTMSICRSRPENRGKGNCPHGEHVEMERIKPNDLMKYNEKVIREIYNINNNIDLNSIPEIKIDRIGNITGGHFLRRDELNEASSQVALHFPIEEWNVISDFYQNISSEADFKRLDKTLLNRPNSTKAVLAMETATLKVSHYLASDDSTAKRVRRFLGEEVSTQEISKLLVAEVGSMKTSQKWRNTTSGNVLKRTILTTVGNDMTRERYVASVLFFGGRCCYCNRVLRKNPDDGMKVSYKDATGEHITPLSPSTGNIVGGTRYGNMALACHRCNADRGNRELKDWMAHTRKVSPPNKAPSLKRIEVFRKFALYRDYNENESNILLGGIREMEEYMKNFKVLSTGKYSDQDARKIDREIKTTIFDLSEKLRQS